MSHEIVNNMMAYKGQKPWHDEGNEVPQNATTEEMVQAAKLDWPVELRTLAMVNNGALLAEPLDAYRAVVNGKTNQVFQVSSNRYNIVQNSDIVDVFRNYCDAGHGTLETMGALRGGAIVWALAKLNGGDAAIGGTDSVKSYVLMATSHDGSLPTIGKATQIRVVCWNTLSAALKGGADFKMKHSKKWSTAMANEAREKMGIALARCEEVNALSAKLANVKIDAKGRLEFLTRVLGGENILEQVTSNTMQVIEPGNILDAMIANQVSTESVESKLSRVGRAVLDAMISSPGSELATAKDTLWGAVNGVTYYCDHERGRTNDARLANSWFGTSDTMKNTAMIVAAQMAGFDSPLVASN